MNANKREAFIQWLNALVPTCKISSLLDLKDGNVYMKILELCDDCFVPDFEVPQNTDERFSLIKQYLEGFFSVTFDPGNKLLDFDRIHAEDISNTEKEWELGKILLALLEACVLEKKNNDFVTTAMALPQLIQLEIMEMLRPMIINSQEIGNHLAEDFADILTKSSVTQGNMSHVTSTPTVDHSFNFSRFSNHVGSPVPQCHTSLGTSVHEIASPLRMLTIANSPVTPLGALMQSPQLAQKALIRQKEREIKKLELSLQNERHLRAVLDFDIQEKTDVLDKKENRIKEFEKQQRKVQDMADEIDSLKTEKERNEKDMARLQFKMNELQNMKDHCSILEKENKQLMDDYSQMRIEVQTMESLKKSQEQYRTQCHIQSVKLSEMEALLLHRNGELESKHKDLCNSEERSRNLISQMKTLKKEKEELEELLSCRDVVNGESMGVISDMRIKDLEEELFVVKSSWLEPSQHEHLQQKLMSVTEAKETFESKCVNIHKMYLEKDSETDQLQFDISQLKSNMTTLENCRDELNLKVKDMEVELEQLHESESRLIVAKETAMEARQSAEEQVLNLQKDLSRLQSEMTLTVQELESTKLLNENRRQTLAASYDVALTEKTTSEQRLLKETHKLGEQVTELRAKLQTEKEEGARQKELLNTKVQVLQSSLKQTEILLENEKWTKDNVITAMKEELQELQDELIETEKRLQNDVTKLTQVKCNLEDQLAQQKDSYMIELEQINEEFVTYKSNARQKENSMCNQIQNVKDENICLKNELENLKTGTEKSSVSWEQKYSKLENKAKAQEEDLMKELKVLQDKCQWSLHDQQTLSDEISDLKENMKEKCLEIENLQSEIMSHKQSENDLKGQLSQVTNCKENIQRQLEELLHDFSTERDSHAALLTKISQEHEKDIQKLKDSLSSKEASNLNTRQNLEKCINETQTSLEKEITKGKENERISSVKISQLENKVTELQTKMEEDATYHNKTVVNLNNDLEQLRMTIAVSEEMTNKELQKCRSDLSKVTTEYGELNIRYKSVTENERTLDGRMNQLHQQISTLESQKKVCENLSDEMKEKIDDLTGQIVLIKKVAESKQADNDKLGSENKNLNIKVEELNEKLVKECKDNDSMRHKCKEQDNRVTHLENELSDVNTRLKDTDRVLEEKVHIISLQDQEIDSLKISFQNLEKEAAVFNEQILKITDENSDLCEKLNVMESELDNLKAVFTSEKDGLHERIKFLMESHKHEISELKKSNEEKTQELNSEIDRLKSDLMSCDTEIHKLEQEIKNLKSSIEALKQQHVHEINSLCSEKDMVVKTFEAKISEIRENFGRKKNELIESHKAEIESLNSEYLSSKDHFKRIEQELRNRLKNETQSLQKDHQYQIDSLNEKMKAESEQAQSMKAACERKVTETEKYWKSQLEQLEVEYHRASLEQKQDYNNQVQEQEMRYQSQYEVLVEEKDMILSNQKITFQDRVKQLETRLSQKQNELLTLTNEMNEDKEKVEMDYKQKLANIESLLKKEMGNQKDLMNELKQNKERVNELQSALREKRTSYESSLAASSKTRESEIESLREEYNGNILQLEREKNRQIEDEKQCRLNLEESCHNLNERIEMSTAENNRLKQQLAAVEEEKNQLILDYERTLDNKIGNHEDQEKLKSQVQKSEVKAKFYKEQLESKVKELKEEIAYTENHWSEELDSCRKQCSEANQQKIHLQQQMKNTAEETEKKDKIIMQYKKYYAQKKEMNQILQQEVNVNKNLAEKFKIKAETLEAELALVKTSYKNKSEKLESDFELLKKNIEEQKHKSDKSEMEVAPLKLQLQEELNKNKALESKVNRMEVQLEFADKQVRDFRQKLDEAGSALLGDNTEFLKMKKESDVSLMETSCHDDGCPPTPYDLRSKSRKLSLRHHSNSDGDEKNLSPMSLRSHGRRTSLSDPNLNSTIASIDSVRSTTSRGMKRFVNDEDDEGEVLEWKRLGELSRRNTLCLPHLKTSYPVETQKIQLRAFPDKFLKDSCINQENLKKRKKELVEEDELKTEFYDSSRHKQAKHGINYQKPGPPTPGNTNRRNSRGTPGRRLHSPRSPVTTGRTNSENPSTAFNIGFTPKNKRLRRQQGFVTSSSKSTSKGHRDRQPLAVINCFQQTGV